MKDQLMDCKGKNNFELIIKNAYASGSSNAVILA